MSRLRKFLADTLGQDLVEYTLFFAFVALASMAMFLGAGVGCHGSPTRLARRGRRARPKSRARRRPHRRNSGRYLRYGVGRKSPSRTGAKTLSS